MSRIPASIAPSPAIEFQSGTAGSLAATLDRSRSAQARWKAVPVRERLRRVRAFRAELARDPLKVARAAAADRQRPVVEVLTAEVMPLLSACRFLERAAAKALASRQLGRRGRPFWLGGVVAEVQRDPHGVVGIIAPGNYPLFLPAVQALQALVAGNSVWIKPGQGGADSARLLEQLFQASGWPEDLIVFLPDTVDAARALLQAGVDKVIFTGSRHTGRLILNAVADSLIPTTMELSGCDAVIVRADADLDLVTRSLIFGLTLNAGATCIAPRRVFVHRAVVADLQVRLVHQLAENRGSLGDLFPPDLSRQIASLVQSAIEDGASLLAGRVEANGRVTAPLMLGECPPHAEILRQDLFAPVLSIVSVPGDDDAVRLASAGEFRLGAAIFSRDESRARALAQELSVGTVTINDVILPTADPRLPFGGRGQSGFGTTRGLEGLQEMTVPKVVTVSRGRVRRHLQPAGDGEAALIAAALRAAHGRGWRERFRGLIELVRAARTRGQKKSTPRSI